PDDSGRLRGVSADAQPRGRSDPERVAFQRRAGSGTGQQSSNPALELGTYPLERDHVRHLRDDGPVDQSAAVDVAAIVEYQVEIAQRAVDHVEADVRAPLAGIGVV